MDQAKVASQFGSNKSIITSTSHSGNVDNFLKCKLLKENRLKWVETVRWKDEIRLTIIRQQSPIYFSGIKLTSISQESV